MKFNTLILLVSAFILSNLTSAQTKFETLKAGHTFTIDIPNYMSKTIGLNSAAAVQFKSTVKDVYGFVIYDTREELTLADMNYTSAKEFYDDFIKDFLKGEKNRLVGTPANKKEGETTFVSCDVSYYDKEAKTTIYYFVGVVETPKSFYKVLCWTTGDKKAEYRSDFEKIMLSLKD